MQYLNPLCQPSTFVKSIHPLTNGSDHPFGYRERVSKRPSIGQSVSHNDGRVPQANKNVRAKVPFYFACWTKRDWSRHNRR